MKRVLFTGDINVDVMMGGLECFPVLNREITCESFEVTMGSSAVIAACAYASLGGNAAFLGLAGEDDYGAFMLKGMQGFGIDTGRVRRTTRVRTGVTVNLTLDDTRTQITYPGAISEFEASDLDVSDFQGIDHLHFAGPYQQTKFRPEIARILKLAAELGITTSLDPQWDASERWEGMVAWLPLLSYLFVNEDEALSIAKAETPEAACQALAGRTACPVVKAGRAGSLLPIDGQVTPIPTREIDPVDTTGAGDAFAAGFLFAVLEKEMNLPDAARFGNAVGARSCLFVGGVNARSTYDDIVAFMEETK